MTYGAHRAGNRGAWSEPRRAEAATLLVAIRDGLSDPLSLIDALEPAVEAMCAGDGDDRLLAYQAVSNAIPVFRDEERIDPCPLAERLRTRARLCVLLARAEVALELHDRAFETAYAALMWLEQAAGGANPLVDALRWPRPTAMGQLAVSSLAVYASALRGAQLRLSNVERHIRGPRELVRAYARTTPRAAVYPHSVDLAHAWCDLLRTRDSASDQALVAALASWGVQLRRSRVRPVEDAESVPRAPIPLSAAPAATTNAMTAAGP